MRPLEASRKEPAKHSFSTSWNLLSPSLCRGCEVTTWTRDKRSRAGPETSCLAWVSRNSGLSGCSVRAYRRDLTIALGQARFTVCCLVRVFLTRSWASHSSSADEKGNKNSSHLRNSTHDCCRHLASFNYRRTQSKYAVVPAYGKAVNAMSSPFPSGAGLTMYA